MKRNPRSRTFRHTIGLIVALCLYLLPSLTLAQAAEEENAVLRWNDAMLEAVRKTNTPPPITARALAIVHTAMFDAWAAYDHRAVATQTGATLRRPIEERTEANKNEAISFAAYRTLLDLFPSQKALFDALMAEYGYDGTDLNRDGGAPSGIGNIMAGAVLAYRHKDGSNQMGDLNPGAYSDYTGYSPVNTADRLINPNRWQPIRLPNGNIQKFLVPHWGEVKPFALASGADITPERAPVTMQNTAFGWAYRQQALEVLGLSAALGDREKMIAEYWADGPHSETPPGHWNLLAHYVSQRDRHTLDQDVQMFFALNNALMDTSIAVWHCKRESDYVRPISAIRYLFRGQRVRAWGGANQGTKLIFGETWMPYQAANFITPPFGEYVSGHSTFSAASGEILKLFTGSDHFGASVTLPVGSSLIEPGQTPSTEITLSWPTFTAAVEEAGISRLYGGIHFMSGNVEGQRMGRKIGAKVWEKAQSYIDGTAPVN